MKRLLILVLLTTVIFSVAAEDRYKDKEIREINLSTEDLEGKAKAGLALGYPFGFTFGYRPANYLELNLFAGTHFDNFTIGGSVLFTIANISIKDEIFPLSVGPALYSRFGDEYEMMAGAQIRWEYSFKEIPLNLYIQATPGFTFINDFGFDIASSLGVRYIF
jgi:hypothetical protein